VSSTTRGSTCIVATALRNVAAIRAGKTCVSTAGTLFIQQEVSSVAPLAFVKSISLVFCSDFLLEMT